MLVWNGGGGDAATTNYNFVNYDTRSADKEDLSDWETLQIMSQVRYDMASGAL